MAKTYNWEIIEKTVNEETEEEITVPHTVSLKCSYLTGKALITIDGTEFNIGTRPFGLGGTNQVFRLGELAAIIDFPKGGAPVIVINSERISSGSTYEA